MTKTSVSFVAALLLSTTLAAPVIATTGAQKEQALVGVDEEKWVLLRRAGGHEQRCAGHDEHRCKGCEKLLVDDGHGEERFLTAGCGVTLANSCG